jgi:hypothetical protein
MQHGEGNFSEREDRIRTTKAFETCTSAKAILMIEGFVYMIVLLTTYL